MEDPLFCHLSSMLKTMIQNMRISGAPMNIHTVHGVLAGLVGSCRKVWTVSWFSSNKTMCEITLSLYGDVSPCFNHLYTYHNTCIMKRNKHPIFTWSLLSHKVSKFMAASKVTMAEQASKHVSIAGKTDKHCITLTVAESMSG